MTNTHTRGDWKRLGTAVQAARMRRRDIGIDNTAEWADAVGRSSRVLLGLERGDPTGAKTLRRIEEELNWPVGWCDVILDDPSADTAPEQAHPSDEGFDMEPAPRPLDEYTPLELLRELEDRIVEMAMELHALGRPATTTRKQGATTRKQGEETIVEAMSPAQRRRLKMRPARPIHDLPRKAAPTADTSDESRR